MPVRPALFTFDVFGTVLDWREGLRASLAVRGHVLAEGELDRIVDRQGAIEHEPPFRSYREIIARSLVDVLGLPPDDADAIGREAGTWPIFLDSKAALLRLQRRAPCVAMTNSDRAHGLDIQGQLGFRLSRWLCAEAVGVYKPDPAFWYVAAGATGAALGPAWWHVSAYGDYDLDVARRIGLTTVLVNRPHRRVSASDVVVPDLRALADMVDRLWPALEE